MEDTSRKTQESMDRTAQTMGDTIVQVVDKLAGKKSQVKLSFQDLSLEAGAFKTKMTGAIVLESTVAKEIETSSYKSTEPAAVYNVT
jgi:hypothetical protein